MRKRTTMRNGAVRSLGRALAAAAVVLAAACGLLLDGVLGGRAARAYGLDYLCAAPAPPPPADVKPMLTGGKIVFDGEGVNGTFAHQQEWTPDLKIDGAIVNTTTGAVPPDRFRRVNVPGTTAANDYEFGFGVRFNTFGTQARDLMRDNFGVPFDARHLLLNPHSDQYQAAGVDVIIRHPSTSGLDQYRATFGIKLVWTAVDANGARHDTYTLVRLGLDSRGTASRAPDELRLSLVFKAGPAGAAGPNYLVLNQKATYANLQGPRPPLRVLATVQELNADGTPRLHPTSGTPLGPVADVALDWSRSLADFAFGLKQVCNPGAAGARSTGHVAVSRPPEPAGTPPATLGVDLRAGVGAGTVIGTDPLGGPVRTDQVRARARLVGVPERFDLVTHPDTLSLTRSAETPVSLELTELVLGLPEGSATTPDAPLWAKGTVASLPEHLHAEATFADAARTDLRTLDVSAWTPQCLPTNPAAADDTFPHYRNTARCRRDPSGRSRVGNADFTMQNYVEDDLANVARMAGMPRPLPLQGGPYVLYWSLASRQGAAQGPTTRPLYRMSARVEDAARAGLALGPNGAAGRSVKASGDLGTSTTAPGAVYIGVDERTHDDPAANRGMFVWADALLTPFPTRIDSFEMTTAGTATDVAYRTAESVQVAGNAYALLPGPTAMEVRGRLDLQGDAGGLPRSASVSLRRATTAGRSATEISYAADDRLAVRAGLLVSTLAERSLAHPYRIKAYTEMSLPDSLSVRAVTEDATGRLVDLDAAGCHTAPNPAACTNTMAVTAVSGPAAANDLATIFTPPALPDIPDGRGGRPATHPPFTTWTAEGLTAVMVPYESGLPNQWGVRGRVENVASVGLHQTPESVTGQRVCVRSSPVPNRRFVVSLFDGTNPTQLYADGAVDRLPPELFAVVDGSVDPYEPMLWVALACGQGPIPRGLHSTERPDPATAPLLRARVRYGAPGDLSQVATAPDLEMEPMGGNPPVTVPGDLNRVRVNAFAGAAVALDGLVKVTVPRHLVVRKPVVRLCDPTSAGWATCGADNGAGGTLPAFERSRSTDFEVRFDTTSEALVADDGVGGAVSAVPVKAAVKLRGATGASQDVAAELARIPGTLDVGVTMRENTQLPWTDVSVYLGAATPVGDLHATVTDEGNPAYKSGWILPANRVPNYELRLRNVGANLRVNARLHSSEDANWAPPPPAKTCKRPDGSEVRPRGPAGLAYMAADADLAGKVTNVGIDFAGRHDVDGLDNIAHPRDPDPGFAGEGPPYLYKADLLGLPIRPQAPRALSWSADNGTQGFRLSADSPLTATVRAKVENIYVAEELAGTARFCADLDLPVEVSLSGVRDLRVAVAGPRLFLALPRGDHPAGAALKVGAGGGGLSPRAPPPPPRGFYALPRCSLGGGVSVLWGRVSR